MSLFTNPRAIAISDGESSFESDGSGRDAEDYAYRRPRRYGDSYHMGGGSSSSSRQESSDASSVDELVRHRLRQRYTDLERELGTAAGFSSSPFRSRDGGGGNYPQLPHGLISGLRRGILVDEGSDSDGENSDEAVAREVACLQRLHRGLMNMRVKDSTGLGNSDAENEKPKKKVVVDQTTIDRLTKPNASMAAKKQEKYEKRLEREQNEKPKTVKPSAVSIQAGERLHLQAKGAQKHLEERRKALAEEATKQTKEEYTFQPTITRMAERLAADGHRSAEERLAEYRLRQEEMERRRIDRQVEEMRRHPFRPTLARGTNQIVEERRARSCSRAGSTHKSRSRSRTRSRSRGRNRSKRRCRRALDDPAERLYRDGGERLLRQQIRQRQAEQARGNDLIGNRVRLTRDGQEQIQNRLEAWQETREKNLAALREEAERMRKEKAKNLFRSTSCSWKTTTPAGNQQAATQPSPRETGATSVAEKKRRGKCRPAPTEKAEVGRAVDAEAKPAAPASVSPPSTAPSSFIPCSAATVPPLQVQSPPNPFAHFTPQQKAMYDELRRIRLGALFYKFTAGSPTGDTITLDRVRWMVDILYPEDAGVVDVLRSAAGTNPQVSFSKSGFIQVLSDYERQFGPQPWARSEKDGLLFPPSPARTTATAASAPQGRAAAGEESPASSTRLVRSASLPESRRSSRSTQRREPDPGRQQRESRHTQTPRAVRDGAAFNHTASVKSAASDGKAGEVAGYARHVARVRSCSDGDRGRQPTRTAPRRPATPPRAPPPECTFTPQLGKRTVRLSNVELQRRAGYAQERELRRRELALMRTIHEAEDPTRKNATPAKAPPPLRGGASTALAVGDGDQSPPSVELSSLSGSLGRSPSEEPPASSAAVQRPALSSLPKPRTPLQGAAASKAMQELQALLNGGSATVPASSPTVTTAPTRATGNSAPRHERAESPRATPQAVTALPPRPTPKTTATDTDTNANERTKTPRAAGAKTEGAKGAAFTEDDMDELFNAMYRGGARSAWL